MIGCSDDDPEPSCFQEENRRIVETVSNVQGIVFLGCIDNYILHPSIRLNNNLSGILSPCNLSKEFQQDGLRVIFSGHIYESFDTEDICADYFEVTEIQIDTTAPSSDDLVGFWQLSHYQTPEGRIDPPNDDKPVYWRLKYNGTMNGMAGNNFLEAGQYGISDGFLTLTFGVTEVAATEWEERFYSAIAQTFNGEALVIPYSIENGELVLNYSDDDTMHFERKP
jgi:hypothetical protein